MNGLNSTRVATGAFPFAPWHFILSMNLLPPRYRGILFTSREGFIESKDKRETPRHGFNALSLFSHTHAHFT